MDLALKMVKYRYLTQRVNLVPECYALRKFNDGNGKWFSLLSHEVIEAKLLTISLMLDLFKSP